MKHLLLFSMLILVLANLYSNELIESGTTLSELSEETDIPIKKIKNLLDLPLTTADDTTLQQLEKSKTEVELALQRYQKEKQSYYWGIVMVGMLIVFASLVTVGIIISQLKRLKKKEKQTISTSVGKVTAPRNISQNDIVAVITAIYLHEMETDEQNKLLLTWKRSSVSMWNAASKMNYPNRSYYDKIRNR